MNFKIFSTAVFIFLSLTFTNCLSINKYNLNQRYDNKNNNVERKDSTDDEAEYYYPSYYYINVSSGYSTKNDLKLSFYSKKFFVNISYRISNLIMPLEIYPTQVGFFNELGINNTSLYLNIGPEARIDRSLYLIPYAGLTIIPFSKYKNENIAVLYYLGISAGY